MVFKLELTVLRFFIFQFPIYFLVLIPKLCVRLQKVCYSIYGVNQPLGLCLSLLVKVCASHVHGVKSQTLACEVSIPIKSIMEVRISLKLALPLSICLGQYVILRNKLRHFCAEFLNDMVFLLL